MNLTDNQIIALLIVNILAAIFVGWNICKVYYNYKK